MFDVEGQTFLQGHATAGPDAVGLSGTVRSYNGAKGFGFIVGQGEFADVMFSRNELPEDAREVRGQIVEGRQVIFDARIQADGRAKATRVQLLAGDGQKLPGIVKSFSAQNGYGFVKSSCLAEDVYFQASDFHGLAPGANIQGQLVLFEPEVQANGKLKAGRIQFQTRKIAEQFCSGVGGHGGGGTVGGGGIVGTGGATAVGLQALAAGLTSGMLPGVVKTFSDRSGYGFINVPGLPVDIMFRQQAVQGGPISQGANVQFSLSQAADGRLQAGMVIPTSAGPGAFAGSSSVNLKRGPGSFVAAGLGGCGNPTPINVGGLSGLSGLVGMSLPMGGGAPLKMQRTHNAVPTTSTGEYRQGTVKSYNPTKGWGLITSPGIPDGGKGVPGDVFFMKSNLPQEARDSDVTGREVTFELATTPEGKYRGLNITVIG